MVPWNGHEKEGEDVSALDAGAVGWRRRRMQPADRGGGDQAGLRCHLRQLDGNDADDGYPDAGLRCGHCGAGMQGDPYAKRDRSLYRKTGVAPPSSPCTRPPLRSAASFPSELALSLLFIRIVFTQTKFVPHFESVSSKMRPEADQRIKASTADGQAGGVLHSVDSLLNDCERLIIYLLSSVPLCFSRPLHHIGRD